MDAPVLVAAGGTGGHLFPAEALAAVLKTRGIAVHLVSSATFHSNNPIAVAKALATLGLGLNQARRLIGRLRPAAVIGFGGYPTIPPVLAAAWYGVPSLIHEANAVRGRANRLLAPRA